MGSKLNVFVPLAFLAAPSNVGAKDTDVRVNYSEVQYLKNFALGVCISLARPTLVRPPPGVTGAGGMK